MHISPLMTFGEPSSALSFSDTSATNSLRTQKDGKLVWPVRKIRTKNLEWSARVASASSNCTTMRSLQKATSATGRLKGQDCSSPAYIAKCIALSWIPAQRAPRRNRAASAE